MFKNIKVSTGINSLMYVFILFLALISFFNISGAHRFDRQRTEALTISNADNVIQDSVGRLNIALGSVSLSSIAQHEEFVKTGTSNLDEQALAEINEDIKLADDNYKLFMSQPVISHRETEKKKEIKKAYEDLHNFTLRIRDTIIDPKKSLLSPDEVADETAKYNTAIRQALYEYRVILNTLMEERKALADAQNSRMLSYACVILLVAIGMMIFMRIWLKRTVFTRLRQTRETFAMLASGDLSQPIDIGSKNEIGEMLAELEKMRVTLTATVSDIRHGVTSIYGSAKEIANSNNELSSRTEQQASALQQTAASMEELKITVRQNADNAHSAKQLVETANSSARKGGDVMVNLDSIMREITDNSRQIADINGVIDSIANQTNILALNAAVEAARAGEQGRGFAVVAGEVRSLAKRSADAAKEIRQLINIAVANMNTGSQEVELAGTAMNEVVKSVTQVTDIMSEITSASDEQSTGINQIAQAVNEMDSVTQQNAGMVEQAASVARSVEEYAHNLEQAVSQFSLQERNQASEEKSSKYAATNTIKKTMVLSEPAFGKNKSEGDWSDF